MGDSKRPKAITVKEIKEISPLSEVYKLDKHENYLVFVPKSNLVGGYEIAHKRAQVIATALKEAGVNPVVVIGTDEGIKILKLEDIKV